MAMHHATGSWALRALVIAFSILFGLLCYWLFGFVVRDIDSLEGPNYEEYASAELDPDLSADQERLEKEIEAAELRMETTRRRQNILQDSTRSAEQTMNQLLQFQRLSIERNIAPSAKEQEALASAETQFLENQQQYSELAKQTAQINEELVRLNAEKRTVEDLRLAALEPIDADFAKLAEAHQWRLAAWKLAAIVPLVIAGAAISWRLRTSVYAPMAYAFATAAAVEVFVVMHDHFPERYFKYILIGALLAIVARALVFLLHLIARPRIESIRKQYREAYESFICPVCSHPIRRGPWKFLAWSRRTAKRVQPPIASETASDAPYTCPACATVLYNKCERCGAVRESLLPACSHCGEQRDVANVFA